MKLCTMEFTTALGKHQRLGAVMEQGIVDLNAACAWHLLKKGEAQPFRLANALVPSNMLNFLQGELTSMTFAKASLDDVQQEMKSGTTPVGLNETTIVFNRNDVTLRAPLPRPTSMRDFYAFEQHVKKGFEKRGEQMPPEWYEMPVYYKGAHWSIIGPDENVHWPSYTEKFDYELELAIIIGKQGRNIPETKAREYIAGFTIMNDFSARDMQRKEMKVRLGPAKGKDFATAIGPVLVTTDEIGDPYKLKMTAKINGEVWSEGNSHSIYHSFEKMIAFASQDETLYPGDLIGSGTVGTGCGLELDRWVKPGDLMELEIEKIGVLRNKVVRG
ncbi:MAG: fumarylacetoacetate hydrolase family protein [Ignavibacteria bacterium]|nr:fumarylacetoacetate hydrolase family protein [Ignavibacteria bacterium]MBI3766528.1 fumarylacetoacetate hydrolase family protein [Ignavibacteriales bacterium]